MATKWKKTYTDISNVNGGNEYETGDHITKETVNVALNNTAYLQQTKVTAESNKYLFENRYVSNDDLNNYRNAGMFYFGEGNKNTPDNTNWLRVLVIASNTTSDGVVQIAFSILSTNQETWYRRCTNNTWSPWLRTDVQPALYNLGAYDTISFNDDGTASIVRQTGYWNSNNAAVNVAESYHYTNGMRVQYDKVSNIDSGEGEGKAKSNWAYGFEMISKPSNINYNSTAIWLGFPYIFVNGKADLTSALEYINKNPVSIEYKLATPYTEKIITGVPQITLDKQGCEWLRSEWEKGLNLLDSNHIINNTKIYSNLPAGTYTFSLKTTGDGDGFNLKIDKLDGVSLGGAAIKKSYGVLTFTTTKVIDLFYNGWGNANTNYDCMLVRSSIPYPYQPYHGELIRQSTLENQVPMLGVQGGKKVMLGCRGQYYNGNNFPQYVYLAKWDDLGEYTNDSGIHIKGIIGGWLFNRQAVIDVVASYREGWTFKGFMNEKQTVMNIVSTDSGKVYLELPTDYISYNIDIECGMNGTITYTGDILDGVDGNIVANLNEQVNVQFPYLPLNGGLKANTSATNWGVLTGSEVASFNDITGGSFKFRRDCPSNGQISLVIDGSVYVNEGRDKVLTSADVSNKLDANATSITNAQGEWFTSESGHIGFGTSTNQTRIYSSDRPQWWKSGTKQGEIALTSDIEPKDIADYGASSVKVDAGALYVFSVYIEDDRKFYTGSIYVPNNFSNPCRSAIIATFGNYKYLVTCGQRSSASAQGTLRIEKQLLDESAGTNTNSYFNKVFKMF